jgi:hypothetical protein
MGAPWQHEPIEHHREDDMDRMSNASGYTLAPSGQVEQQAWPAQQGHGGRLFWSFVGRWVIAASLAISAVELLRSFLQD